MSSLQFPPACWTHVLAIVMQQLHSSSIYYNFACMYVVIKGDQLSLKHKITARFLLLHKLTVLLWETHSWHRQIHFCVLKQWIPLIVQWDRPRRMVICWKEGEIQGVMGVKSASFVTKVHLRVRWPALICHSWLLVSASPSQMDSLLCGRAMGVKQK